MQEVDEHLSSASLKWLEWDRCTNYGVDAEWRDSNELFTNSKEWAHKPSWLFIQRNTGRKNEMMTLQEKSEEASEKVSPWIMNTAFISSSLASDILVLPSFYHLSLHPSSPILFQSTPAILSLGVKERRGSSDAGLTQTRHTPRHVTGSTTMAQTLHRAQQSYTGLSYFTWMSLPEHLLEMSLQFSPMQIITKGKSIMSRTRADPTHWAAGKTVPHILLDAAVKQESCQDFSLAL